MNNQSDVAFATPGEQHTYWGFAFFCTLTAAIGLVYLVVESKRNKAFSTPIVRCFSVIMVGDILFIACFLPYHSYNSILALIGGEFIDPKDSPLCLASWFFASVSIQLQLWGFTLLGYAPLKMVNDSVTMRPSTGVPKRVFALTYGTAIICALIWFFVGLAYKQLGSNRGLYCAASSWANFQGAWMFATMGVSLTGFAVMFTMAYARIQRIHTQLNTGTTQSDTYNTTEHLRKGAMAVLKFGTIMISFFFLTWGTFAVICMWNAFSGIIGSHPPVSVEIFAGISAKTKPILDVITILSMPVVKHERRKRIVGI